MIDALAENGQHALRELAKLDQTQIDHIVHAMAMAAVDKHMELAKAAYEETGRGIYEDKAIKNLYASEYIWQSIKYNKTIGVIDEDEQRGLTYVASPVGVVC
ncbi:bifunctional acetaldehyde-CoA/alcohol dehydrogenase, partial [Staphylococcus nepalensis]